MLSPSSPHRRTDWRWPWASSSWVCSSSTGLASRTPGWARARSSQRSSSRPARPRSWASGSPLALWLAAENSDSADALINCTDSASPTPSITASTAIAWRQGCRRSSCQEKVLSSVQ